MTTYTPDLLIKLFEEITEIFGPWNRNTWLPTPPRPANIDADRLENQFQLIYNKILPAFEESVEAKYTTRVPKSNIALDQQLRWCLTIQRKMDKGQSKMQRRNRIAAYKAGFLTMGDICYLEKLADIRELLKNQSGILFTATHFSEGIDVPDAKMVIIDESNHSKTTSRQIIGRTRRSRK